MAKARRSHGRSHWGCGFTLVETLVVLAVLAVLLGLAVPGLAGMRARQQLQAQAQAFWNSLMLARAQALLHQQRVTVCAASGRVCDAAAGWHGGWLVFVDNNRNGLFDAGERLLEQRAAAPPGLRITGNNTVSRTVGYGVEGRSETLGGGFQAGTVSLCWTGRNEGWRVVINAVGRPRLEKDDVTDCP